MKIPKVSLAQKSEQIGLYTPGNTDATHLYTKGGEFSLNGTNYIGEYHTNNGMPYTGPTKSSGAVPLQRFYSNPDHFQYEKLFNFHVDVAQFVDPVPYLYSPKPTAYKAGFDMRYFVEKINDDQSYPIEVDKNQYSQINAPNGIDGGIYGSAAVSWKLTGFREDIINYNQNSLIKASQTIPGALYAVRNFLEFAQITLV